MALTEPSFVFSKPAMYGLGILLGGVDLASFAQAYPYRKYKCNCESRYTALIYSGSDLVPSLLLMSLLMLI